MKRLVTFIFAFIYILNAWAAKSAGTPMLVFQPDGMTVTIQLLGDENFSWYQTTDGVLLVRNESEYYIAKVVPEVVTYLRNMSPLWDKIKKEN